MMHRFTPAFILSTFLVALAALQSVSATPLPEAGVLVERALPAKVPMKDNSIWTNAVEDEDDNIKDDAIKQNAGPCQSGSNSPRSRLPLDRVGVNCEGLVQLLLSGLTIIPASNSGVAQPVHEKFGGFASTQYHTTLGLDWCLGLEDVSNA
ncbi:hypothetical protein DFP72DRAFT_854949 [Ephemerocybe angulata]|uniref:Uncharacterized protein n=1 Tax=Ephemerocybe angulata TaxID=980116 RepID=A0A8H6HH11_9AGAR|nr:hypothetical protein DFP72DRAFT_854949 [Tulosesus angulatus]